MTVLAMFPLGSVLFPGAALPLHVFEPRYQALVRDCLATPEPEFGVVLIERGSEVGGGDLRHDVGTVARIVAVQELGDGRSGLVCVGTRRMRVARWLPDDPYPRAEAEEWPEPLPDDVGALVEPYQQAQVRLRRVLALAAEAGEATAPATVELPDDPLLGSHLLSALAPVGPADQHLLLAAPGPGERLALLLSLLEGAEELLRFRLAPPPPC